MSKTWLPLFTGAYWLALFMEILENLMFHFGLNYEGNNWFDKGQPLAIYGYSGSSLKAQLNPKDSPLDLLLNTAQVSKKMNVCFIVHENLNWIDVCSF